MKQIDCIVLTSKTSGKTFSADVPAYDVNYDPQDWFYDHAPALIKNMLVEAKIYYLYEEYADGSNLLGIDFPSMLWHDGNVDIFDDGEWMLSIR